MPVKNTTPFKKRTVRKPTVTKKPADKPGGQPMKRRIRRKTGVDWTGYSVPGGKPAGGVARKKRPGSSTTKRGTNTKKNPSRKVPISKTTNNKFPKKTVRRPK